MALFSTATKTKKISKRVLIILVIVIVVAAAAVAGAKYYYFVPRHAVPTAGQAASKGEDLGAIVQKAQDFKANNQTDQGLAYYDTQIKLHASKDDQAGLLAAKAQLALGADKLDVALAAAQQANQAKETFLTLQLLGDITKAKGDNAAALEYYKQALAAVPSNMPMIGPNNIKMQLNAAIKELSA